MKVWGFKEKSLEEALQVDQQFGKYLFSIFKAEMPMPIFTTNCIARHCNVNNVELQLAGQNVSDDSSSSVDNVGLLSRDR